MHRGTAVLAALLLAATFTLATSNSNGLQPLKGHLVLPGDKPSGDMQFQPGTGATQTSGKLEWPEFVGEDGNTAKEAIEKEGYTAYLVPEGSVMTMDYRTDRVRIHIDSGNKVIKTPKVG